MQKKRRRPIKKPSVKRSFVQHLLKELCIAVVILLMLLLFFAVRDDPSGQAVGGMQDVASLDQQLAENIRLCNEGQEYACERVYELARNYTKSN